MKKPQDLAREGWVKRGTYDEPRLTELVDLYGKIGFTVHIEPFNPFEGPGCTDCMKSAPEKYKVLYTQKNTADQLREENAMHKLLTDNPGQKMLLLGNEAIARGAVEAGVAVGTTYPGTPSSEISLMLFQMSDESDLYFEYSTNEKVALEVAAATANAGVRTMCMMKHVGLNVAADPLMTLAYVGVKAGLVIITADDPFMFSSQNEQDNRYYGKLSGLPVLEPSSVEEAKEMIGYAFDLSEQLNEPVIFRTTTRINHSNAVVTLGEIPRRVTTGDFTKDPFNYVTVPAVSRNLHVKLLENLDKAGAISEQSPYNFIEGSGTRGIICNGVSYGYVSDAVKDMGIADDVSILRIGFSHPMPERMIKKFLKGCDRVLVVEEGEPVMEEAVKAFAQEAGLTLPIRGKAKDLFSRLYEFSPALVREKIGRLFQRALYGQGRGGHIGCPGNTHASAEPLCGLFSPGHLLCGQKSRPGHGDRLPVGYRLLHPRISPAAGHGRFSDLHGIVGEHFMRVLQSHRQESHRFYRRFHVLSTPASPVWSMRCSTTTISPW